MRKLSLVVIAIMLNSTQLIFAQKSKVEAKVYLKNGDILTGNIQLEKINLKTDYGKLDIPLKDVSDIKLGLQKNEANTNKIKNLLKQLSPEEATSKKAYDELLTLGEEIIPVIEDYITSDAYEGIEASHDYIPEKLLEDAYATYGLDANYSTKDIITLNEGYELGGSYDVKNIKVLATYGSVDVLRNKIDHIEIINVDTGNETNANGEKSFKLLGAKHISGNANGGWLKTGIQVSSSENFQIKSIGSVILSSLGNVAYSPNGKAKTKTPNPYEEEYEGAASNYPTYGNVVFKIGKNGVVKKAGANFSGKAEVSGELYISIYEPVFNPQNKGSYTVRIKK